MKTIAIDLDDVISSQTTVFIQFSNQNFGTTLTDEDFQRPGDYWGYYEKIWEVEHEEAGRRFKQFLDEQYPLRQVVEPEVLQALSLLERNFRLEIITARGLDFEAITLQWLKQQAPNIFADIHFVDLWSHKLGERATKGRICQLIGAGYLIDDNAEHCNLAAEVGIKGLLFGEFGWNKYSSLHPLVTRVSNWADVLEYFDVRNQ